MLTKIVTWDKYTVSDIQYKVYVLKKQKAPPKRKAQTHIVNELVRKVTERLATNHFLHLNKGVTQIADDQINTSS